MKYKKYPPYPHQLHVLEMSRKNRDIGILHGLGSGKTFSSVLILRDKYTNEKRLMRTLILSPLVTLQNWANEIEMHSYIPRSNVHVLSKGGSKGKVNTFTKHAMNPETMQMNRSQIFITNYESLNSEMLHKFLMEWRPEIIICDESHMVKNPKAKRSKALVKLADLARNRIIMTGTPILNQVTDVFQQFRTMDLGETFGKNYHVFLSKYLEDENAGFKGKKQYFPKLVPRHDMFEDLTDKIYTKCHRVRTTDVLKDLPPLIRTVRAVELAPEQRKHYKQMERDFITFIEEKEGAGESKAVVAQLAVTKALRLQQICVGYLTTEDGEEITLDKNPRIDATKELLQEIVLDNKHQCILWCSFKHDYKVLAKLCDSLGITYGMITGQQNLEQKQQAMDDLASGKIDTVIANRRAGGIGVNLVTAKYSIVYSRNFSLGEEIQSEARNYRGGSQIHDSVVKIDLIATGTIDEQVVEALTNKNDISKKVVDLIRSK